MKRWGSGFKEVTGKQNEPQMRKASADWWDWPWEVSSPNRCSKQGWLWGQTRFLGALPSLWPILPSGLFLQNRAVLLGAGGHSAGRCVQVTSMFKDPGQWKQQNLAPLEHVLFPAPSLCTLELDQKEQSVQRTLNFTFSFHFPGSIFHSYWSRFVLLRWSTFTWRPQPGMDLASKWIGKCRCLFYLTSLCDL